MALSRKEKALVTSIVVAVTAILLVLIVSVTVSLKRSETRDEILLRPEVAGLPLTTQEFTSAKQLKDVHNDENPIATQFSHVNLFEGDIDIESTNPSKLQTVEHAANAINFKTQPWLEWPGGVLPYKISAVFSSRERLVIAKAMGRFHENTCIRFRQYNSGDKDYIFIVKGQGCSSHVGRIGGAQRLSLGSGCICYDPCREGEGFTGIVQHEMMHAVGFHHEQSRTDRDDYVTINFRNIQPGLEYNFKKYGKDKVDALGSKYDTCSLMHYGTTDFSRAGRETITVNQQGNCEVGQRETFSDTDIRKINTLYKCTGFPKVIGIGGGEVKGCSGSADDWSCCTESSPCGKGEGDCDKNSQCEEGLVCGDNNCRTFNPGASKNADCCVKECTSEIEVVRYAGNDDSRGPYAQFGPRSSTNLYGMYIRQRGTVNGKNWWVKADDETMKIYNTKHSWMIGNVGQPGEPPGDEANEGFAHSTKNSDCPEYPNLAFDWNYYDGERWREANNGLWIYADLD